MLSISASAAHFGEMTFSLQKYQHRQQLSSILKTFVSLSPFHQQQVKITVLFGTNV